ncbi:unnamed protein product [Prunus armeniaca]
MGCSSGISHPSQTRQLSGLPFYSQSFSRFPQEALTTSFPVRSNQQAFHKVVTCRTASVSASDDVFTWDDVVKISKPFHISGATRKRSKSAIALSLKIQTLMTVAFIAENRTRAVGDVIKSLGEEHSPAVPRHGGSVEGLDDNKVLAREEYKIFCGVRNFSGSIESGRFINGHVGWKPANSFMAYGVHMNGYVEKDGKKFLWIEKRYIYPGMFDHLVAGGLPPDLDEITRSFPDPERDGFT